MKRKDLDIDLENLTTDELEEFIEFFSNQLDQSNAQWVDEINELSKNINFDPYSFWGEKQLNKISKKYAKDQDGIEYLLEKAIEELKRRENESSNIGDNEEINKIDDKNEFIEFERKKTQKHRDDLI